jgi:hypothetical protein
MAASEEEFHEALTQEVYVDVEKLRSMALHGCPPEVRGDVWKYLLRVCVSDLGVLTGHAANPVCIHEHSPSSCAAFEGRGGICHHLMDEWICMCTIISYLLCFSTYPWNQTFLDPSTPAQEEVSAKERSDQFKYLQPVCRGWFFFSFLGPLNHIPPCIPPCLAGS